MKPLGKGEAGQAWRMGRLGCALLMFALLQACAAEPEDPGYSVVPVWYATDRKATGARSAPEYFSGARGSLSYGKVLVAIPRGHCRGCLEAPSLTSLEFRFDPTRHVTLTDRIEPMEGRAFWDSLNGALAASERREIVVFIHGYRVTFADAARRTGQLFYDLQRPGAAVLYSWPSNGSISSYVEDGENAEFTIPSLKTFLAGVAAHTRAEAVSIIAHSKGNEPLVKALHEMVLENATPLFSEIVLTAPDIDADIFERLAGAVRRLSRRATLYTSNGDQALLAAKELAGGYPRAGDSSDRVIVIDGIETIDASGAETDLFGHSYYAESRSVLRDIAAVLSGKPPKERRWLSTRRTPSGRYWLIRP